MRWQYMWVCNMYMLKVIAMVTKLKGRSQNNFFFATTDILKNSLNQITQSTFHIETNKFFRLKH
uniref:Uncharacterized protein n=1 Tax=Anguilla anguilla TaxID=7936 RepID=A0A0E9S416_ANGAN